MLQAILKELQDVLPDDPDEFWKVIHDRQELKSRLQNKDI